MSWYARKVVPWLVEKACRSSEILEERKRWIPRAHGNVLEIGVGSGLNLAFYEKDHVEHVTGIDPSEQLLARARPRATEAPVPVDLVTAGAEALPFPDASFDTVVTTYTLCSVADPVRALAEIRRVLRPDAQLIFVEHGRAPDRGPQRIQRWLTPAWSRAGGGCRLDRDVATLLREAGLASDDLEQNYTQGPRWLSYTYQGTARRS